MSQHYLHRHLTPAVGEAQRASYGQSHGPPLAPDSDRLGAREITFIRARDSFYLASLTEAGAPYIQHRGGPVGFLRVLDERTLGFADYGGNRQLLTAGHLRRDPRVALFLMDYPARRRLKLDGEAEVVPLQADPQLVELLGPQEAEAGEVERLFLIRVEAFDWNCPQFITPRFTEAELEAQLRPLQERIAELEDELQGLRRPRS
ncbi:pyridoxamine 5'-phosphate oxidase family protein [Synechococcus sp. Tobar12-5m-g]|uniref:pyridoxamine 5'-phosphate oxidase family protein n=1 Tax=unclassified Synechococcus TaxID=2626047 RepID=UPI0020CD7313|nr:MULTISPECIES: pyridoxamine 5'-phosphate oxidase family protein [unclassified Synechococcus]MCP9773703.1 pyridoxamine 5'-phosphate oxidase family protein [Synechococcus sp. Tobar12-5m-g]MCP9874685.1 pyridoxamine 5'-phosphate oxidase family protein [Synechococcus sp. Cruz CV-v-12]